MGDCDFEEDFQDATVALGQLTQTQTQTQTQMDDSQNPEYHPSLEDDMSSTSDSVIVTSSSILSPSIATKKSWVTESIARNKSKNNKRTVYQGKFIYRATRLPLSVIYTCFNIAIRMTEHRAGVQPNI